MLTQHNFEHISFSYDNDKWVDYNVDEDEEPHKPIFNDSVWLATKVEKDEYMARGTSILIKEFKPEIDVFERQREKDELVRESAQKRGLRCYEPAYAENLVFDDYINFPMNRTFDVKSSDKFNLNLRARYYITQESYKLLIVINYFDSTSMEVLNEINDILKTVNDTSS
jgi:hypothetical protein